MGQFFANTLIVQQGRTLAEVGRSLYANLESYLTLANDLSKTQFYTPAKNGNWTPADITDHLHRANLLYRKAVLRASRDEEPIMLPVGQLTDDGKMVAEVALPNPAGRSRSELLGTLSLSVDELVAVGQEAESFGKLEIVCLTGGFFGPLTGLAVLGLASAHIRHHEKPLSLNQPGFTS